MSHFRYALGLLAVAVWLPTGHAQPPVAESKVPFAVMKDWNEARVPKPLVAVLTDEAAYTKLFAESFAEHRSPKPPAEKVDFASKQVVAVCWGARNSTGYGIAVASVTGDSRQTTVTVKTTVPKGLAEPAITYPAVVVVVPKTENVRVVVAGDRVPAGMSDFAGFRTGLEVSVPPTESGGKPAVPGRLPREIDRPNPTWDYDGQRILGHVYGKICLWDAATGKLIHKMEPHKESLCAIRFSPDGGRAFSSSWMGSHGMVTYKSKDTRTAVWNLTTGEKLFDLKGQVAGEFSADGGKLATFSLRPDGSESFDAAVWDALQGRRLATIKLPDYSGPRWDALHFSADGRRVAYAKHGAFLLYNSGGIDLYDAADGSKIGTGAAPNGSGHRFTSAGALASFGNEKAILMDPETGKVVRGMDHDLDRVHTALWSHDGGKVVAFEGGKKLRICDPETGQVIVGAKCVPHPSNRAVASPDDRRVAIVSNGSNSTAGEVGLYELATGREIAVARLAAWGDIIGFSPDGKTLLIGGSEFVVYDAESGKKLRTLKLFDDVSFEPGWNN